MKSIHRVILRSEATKNLSRMPAHIRVRSFPEGVPLGRPLRMTQDLHSIAVKIIKRGARAVPCPKGAIVAVIFIGDNKMRQLNRQYRRKNKTTNVLSFHGDGTDLGDIFISLPEAKREAKKYGWTMQYEVARLALHGFLHLLGYDHIKDSEARKMEAVEVKVLANF